MTFTERRQRVTDSAGTLVLLELSAPSFAAVVRLVNDTRNWESGGQTYVGFPFRFKLPDDIAGAAPRAVLEIDNIGREITADLETLQPGEVVTATIRITDREDPEDIHQTMVIPMTGVVVNQAVVIAQLGVDYLMRQQAVRIRYTPHVAPGIF
jgi:hypothetical protein